MATNQDRQESKQLFSYPLERQAWRGGLSLDCWSSHSSTWPCLSELLLPSSSLAHGYSRLSHWGGGGGDQGTLWLGLGCWSSEEGLAECQAPSLPCRGLDTPAPCYLPLVQDLNFLVQNIPLEMNWEQLSPPGVPGTAGPQMSV